MFHSCTQEHMCVYASKYTAEVLVTNGEWSEFLSYEVGYE